LDPSPRGRMLQRMSDNPKPTELVLHQQSRRLEVTFDDGARFEYPCELLRVYSPSAEVRGHWGQGAKLQVDKQDVNIRELRPVGQYAVKIVFDDGHDSGLYDWRYLYELGRKQAVYWTQYLDRLREAGHERKAPTSRPAE
jgi:DUF971 family protein